MGDDEAATIIRIFKVAAHLPRGASLFVVSLKGVILSIDAISMIPRERLLLVICIVLALLGVLDAGYLMIVHYQNTSVFCGALGLADCDRVLESSYAYLFGIPLALIGLFHYSLLALALIAGGVLRMKIARYAVLLLSAIGLAASLYFVYLQAVVIQAICLYCLGSAMVSVTLFFIIQAVFPIDRKRLAALLGVFYQK